MASTTNGGPLPSALPLLLAAENPFIAAAVTSLPVMLVLSLL